MSNAKRISCFFAILFLLCSGDARANQGIDSVAGSDLPISVGGTLVMTLCGGGAASTCPGGFGGRIVFGSNPSSPTGWINPASGASSFTPTGSVLWFAGTACPAGYLEANGGSASSYPALAAVLGATYGGTGRLPDLRGEFVRGYDAGRQVDSGRVFGSTQASAVASHYHALGTYSDNDGLFGTMNYTAAYPSGAVGSWWNGHGHNSAGGNLAPTTGNLITSLPIEDASGGDTHPSNVALLPCVRE